MVELLKIISIVNVKFYTVLQCFKEAIKFTSWRDHTTTYYSYTIFFNAY